MTSKDKLFVLMERLKKYFKLINSEILKGQNTKQESSYNNKRYIQT